MDNIGLGYCCDVVETPCDTSPLSLSANIERDTIQHEKAHNVLASFTLQACDSQFGFAVRQRIHADFVVVLDTSDSMKTGQKLASVLATIEYMMDVLSENDRFALVQFDETATVLFGLDYLTAEKKEDILNILQNIRTHGNTNISDGLFTALSILQSREGDIPISRILLLTDGLSNRGLSHSEMIRKLQHEELDENLTIHCFGYGKDHSSSCLQTIAFRSPGGLYYYIEDSEHIAETFGDCLAGTFSTVAYSIHVELEAFDGCRFIKIRTKFPFRSVKQMKKYVGSLGSMYEQESRSVLMRMSLRGLPKCSQNLFRVTLRYKSAIDHSSYCHRKLVTVARNQEPSNVPMNKELDRQINRVTSAEAIDKAISAASVKNFGTAEQTINCAIQRISTSITSSDPYCRDLIDDLKDCKRCVSSHEIFAKTGIHEAHQYSTMHNQERSVGMRNERSTRNVGYGYCTTQQAMQMEKAAAAISSYLAAYESPLESSV
uniref:VWFA domain-containing protein n=2 Tax=Vannella robusta TaxID=1487602 RepID=A0A7S4IHF9_9EUKA|mmetsp:Transcript_2592/g.3156  ORF Transcript_2592/g.3156 Transcript_2592/m.3156 type:complete len:490 (+) Transcript_2592:42-1511(+)